MYGLCCCILLIEGLRISTFPSCLRPPFLNHTAYTDAHDVRQQKLASLRPLLTGDEGTTVELGFEDAAGNCYSVLVERQVCMISMPFVQLDFMQREWSRTLTAYNAPHVKNDHKQVPQIHFDSAAAPFAPAPVVADSITEPLVDDGLRRVQEVKVNGAAGVEAGGKRALAESRAGNGGEAELLREGGLPAWNASWPGTFGAQSKNVGNELHLVRIDLILCFMIVLSKGRPAAINQMR